MKRIISIILLTILVFNAMSFANTNRDVNELSLLAFTLNNQTSIKSLDLTIHKLEREIEKAWIESRSMGRSIDDLKHIPEDYRPKGDALRDMVYVRDIYPTLFERQLADVKLQRQVVVKNLENTLNSLLLNVYSSSMSKDLHEEKVIFFSKEYNSAKLKYELGLLTQSDLRSYELNMKTEKLNYKVATDNFELAYLNLKRFVGSDLEIDIEYEIEKTLKAATVSVNDANTNTLTNQAIANRSEIISINNQLSDKLLLLEHYQADDYKYSKRTKEFIVNVNRDIEVLNLKLKNQEISITKEVISALNDIDRTKMSILKLKNSIDTQSKTYDDLLLNEKIGNITESSMAQLAFAITELKNNKSVLDAKLKMDILKFENSLGLGPAY